MAQHEITDTLLQQSTSSKIGKARASRARARADVIRRGGHALIVVLRVYELEHKGTLDLLGRTEQRVAKLRDEKEALEKSSREDRNATNSLTWDKTHLEEARAKTLDELQSARHEVEGLRRAIVELGHILPEPEKALTEQEGTSW